MKPIEIYAMDIERLSNALDDALDLIDSLGLEPSPLLSKLVNSLERVPYHMYEIFVERYK